MSLQYKNEDQEYTHTNEQVRDKVYPILLGRFVHEYQKYAIQALVEIGKGFVDGFTSICKQQQTFTMFNRQPKPLPTNESICCKNQRSI